MQSSNEKERDRIKAHRKSKTKPMYFVEKILAKRKFLTGTKYKVKWQGYSENQCTWESLKHLENVKDMVAEFNRTLREQKKNGEVGGHEQEENEQIHTSAEKPKAKRKHKKKKEENQYGKRELSPPPSSPVKKLKKETSQDIIIEESVQEIQSPPPIVSEVPLQRKIIDVARNSDGFLFTLEYPVDGELSSHVKMTDKELRKFDKDLLLDYYESIVKSGKPQSPPVSSVKEKESEKVIIEENAEVFPNTSLMNSHIKNPEAPQEGKKSTVSNFAKEQIVQDLENFKINLQKTFQNLENLFSKREDKPNPESKAENNSDQMALSMIPEEVKAEEDNN